MHTTKIIQSRLMLFGFVRDATKGCMQQPKEPDIMSDEKTRVQIFLAMNENNDCGLGFSAVAAVQALRNDFGGFGSCLERVVVVDVLMSPPRLVDGGEVDIPDEAGEAETSVNLPEISRASHHSG